MFANLGPLCRLVLRRDWLRSLLWITGLVALMVGFGFAVPGMYPTQADIALILETMKSPTMVVMMGPAYGTTIGALYAAFMVVWSGLILAIMNIFLVVRHTRQDEERGRLEVIRSLPVGRLSSLGAALVSAIVIDAVIAVITGFGLAAVPQDSFTLGGSLLFGVSVGAVGVAFAVVTALMCQLTANPRTAQAWSFGLLILAYLVRGFGDVRSEFLACLSPLGLVVRGQVYVRDLWWPVLVTLGVAAAGAALALALAARRDLGQGLIADRPGRREAAASLRGPAGLAWRLSRSALIVWTVAMLVLGASYGSVMGDMEAFIASNEIFQQMFGDGDPAQFVSLIMEIMAIIGAIPALQFVLRARSQEREGFAEAVLARSVSHDEQLRGYVGLGAVAAVVMPVVTAVGFWLGSHAVMDRPIPLATFLKAALVYVPAIWLMLGLAQVLIAYLPRHTSAAWFYLGYAGFIAYIGAMMRFPDWTAQLSPFGHVPKLPLQDFTAVGLIVMTVLAGALSVAGFVGYSRRDMVYG